MERKKKQSRAIKGGRFIHVHRDGEVDGGVATYPREEVVCPMTIIRDPQGHGAIEGGFRAALTIYRADTRLNRRRCLFSYEVFAIRRRMKTPANTNKRTSERVSEQARCALVESERRLNRLPVHFCL